MISLYEKGFNSSITPECTPKNDNCMTKLHKILRKTRIIGWIIPQKKFLLVCNYFIYWTYRRTSIYRNCMSDQCCQIFQALGDKTRIRILELLKEGDKCVSELCEYFDMTQPSISHHLDILKRCGVVQWEKIGREVYYSFNKDTIIECCGKQMKLFDIKLSWYFFNHNHRRISMRL